MIDRRSSIDRYQQPSLAGTDYVLEGATVRDRFLTAFIMMHKGNEENEWPRSNEWSQGFARMPETPSSSLRSTPLIYPEDESFSIRIESPYEPYEPLTARVIDEWFGADDDDEV